MLSLSVLAIVAWHLLLPPFLLVLCVTLVLSLFGKSLGIRKLYVKALKRIFQLAHKLTKGADRREVSTFRVGDCPDDSEDSDDEVAKNEDEIEIGKQQVGLMREKFQQVRKDTRHNVISRKDNLILTPDVVAQGIIEEEEAPDGNGQERHVALPELMIKGRCVSVKTFQQEFQLEDLLAYVKTGIAAIIEDEVTQRFVAEELKSWNLLTRTSQSFEFVNMKLTLIWIAGCLFRYCILLPCRFCIFIVGLLHLITTTSFISLVPGLRLRTFIYEYAVRACFRIIARCVSADITFHNRHYRPKSDGICVANHTTPIDVVMLNCDRSYALVGQAQSGLFGAVQRALNRATSHIWFDRKEVKDRAIVANRLKEHVDDPNKLPILIFPEGTCINNTSVMQFKKGSFEVGGVVYPVAIKYDPLFGDAFWNSSKYGMMTYMLMMMTSWAIVCDVWYLPPMKKMEGEDAVSFANRVKAVIARQGGLVDLVWDGNLKRAQVKHEWLKNQQQAFSQRIKVD